MRIEVLVSTMNRSDYTFINKMNISTACVVINQSDVESILKNNQDGKKIKFLSFKEKGLSRSRNRAIENSSGDICLIADDDLVYVDNLKDIISNAYEINNEADIIIFRVISKNKNRPESEISKKSCKIGYIKSMKAASYQISFKKVSIIKNNISFDHLFGAGSIFNSGEENIFLFDCLNAKLKVYYEPLVIGYVYHDTSTWFKGYGEKYFSTKGALGYRMFKGFYFLYLIQFLIRKYNIYIKDISLINAFRSMLSGKREYKRMINNDR